MTLKEFEDYIKSFNKNPGEYTEEEILAIGLKHKEELLLGDRDWSKLAETVGFRDGETLRKWILHRRYKMGLVTKNPKILDDKTVEEVTSDDAEKSLTQQKEDLYKERTKLRDTYNSYRKGMREEARIESFKESFLSGLKDLPALPTVQVPELTDDMQAEMVVGFSDLHLGNSFENSYNKYNYEIAVARVSKYVAKIIDYCKDNKVKRLTFLNMGDLVSGIIHPTLRMEQELDAAEQIMKAAELVSEALNLLQEAAPEVIYRSVVDNHSRFVPNKDCHIEAESFNRLIDWYIEERLKGTKVTFANDNIDMGIGMFRLLNGKLFLFTHGHQDRKSTVFQDMVGLTREYPDYIFMGHYHNCAEHTFQGSKVYINGSIIGTDTYAYGKRLFGKPEQKALIFKNGDVLDVNVNLEE